MASTPNSNNWRIGLAMTLGTTLMFAVLPIMIKGLLNHAGPATLSFYRFVAAAALLLAILSFRGKPNTLVNLRNPRLLLTTVLAGLMLGCNYLFFAFGVDHISPSASQVLIQLAPVLLLVGSVVMLKEPFSLRQWCGCGLFVLGILLFFSHRLGDLSGGETLGIGALYIVIAAITWATFGLLQKKLLPHIEAQQLNLVTFLTGALCIAPFTGQMVPDLNASQWLLLALTGANTLIAYACFGVALIHWPATRVSATLTLVPVFTLGLAPLALLIWPGLFTPEPLTLLSYVGAFLVAAGSATIIISK